MCCGVYDVSVKTTNHSLFHEIDGFVHHPLTKFPAFLSQWRIAEPRDPRRDMPHCKELSAHRPGNDHKAGIRTGREEIY